MSKSDFRFHGSKAVVGVLKKGRNRQGQGFFVRQANAPKTSIAVIVSRKVDKRAVVRNKIRRRVREAVVDLAKEGTARGSMVFLVKTPDIAQRDFKQLKSQIKQTLSN